MKGLPFNEMDDYAPYQAFSPREYLASYYGVLGSEAEGLLRFLFRTFSYVDYGRRILEFGGGPTIISLIAAAPKASDITFCDYVAENRAVVRRWLDGDEADFDWTPYIVRALQLEGINQPTPQQIQTRASLIRQKVTGVLTCDIYATPPVETDGPFDVIITNYCLDAVTADKAEWHDHIRNLRGLLAPGGTFMMSSLREAQFSYFGETRFPNVFLQEQDVREALEIAGFAPETIHVTVAAADHPQREYSGVIFGSARDY